MKVLKVSCAGQSRCKKAIKASLLGYSLNKLDKVAVWYSALLEVLLSILRIMTGKRMKKMHLIRMLLRKSLNWLNVVVLVSDLVGIADVDGWESHYVLCVLVVVVPV